MATSPTEPTGEVHAAPERARLLPWIAAERVVRGVGLLVLSGVVLTHLRSDWGGIARWLAVRLGLNPTGRVVSHAIDSAHRLSVRQLTVIGISALAYGVLEVVEGVGLWKRQRWAEYLTVIATSLLIPLELYELAHHATLLKLGGLIANIVIVAYLIRVLRRHEA